MREDKDKVKNYYGEYLQDMAYTPQDPYQEAIERHLIRTANALEDIRDVLIRIAPFFEERAINREWKSIEKKPKP